MTEHTVQISRAQIERLCRYRLWSRPQLLQRAGLDAETLQQAEAQGRAPLPVACALASALGVSPAVLDGASPAARNWVQMRAAWAGIAIAAVMLLSLSFGYQVGADVARQQNQKDCIAVGGADCR